MRCRRVGRSNLNSLSIKDCFVTAFLAMTVRLYFAGLINSTPQRRINMAKFIAACGLLCNECDAFLATATNDNDWRKRLAEYWSKEYKSEINPADINCTACMTKSKPKLSHCSECKIRECCVSRGFENCASCPDFSCEKTEGFYKMAPQAKLVLEEIRKGK